MKLTLNVYSNFPDADCPEIAEVEVSETLLCRVREMRDLAEKHSLYYCCDFECSPVFYEFKDEEDYAGEPREPMDADLLQMKVTRDSFYWYGYLKHSDASFESEAVSVDGRRPACGHNIGKPMPTENG